MNLDDLEKFVVDREYEAIPEVYPDDFGDIPQVPSMVQKLLEFAQLEIQNKRMQDTDRTLKTLSYGLSSDEEDELDPIEFRHQTEAGWLDSSISVA